MTFDNEQRNLLKESIHYNGIFDLFVFDCNDNIYRENRGLKEYKWLKASLTTNDIAEGKVCSKDKQGVDTQTGYPILNFDRMGEFDEDERTEFFIETTCSSQIWLGTSIFFIVISSILLLVLLFYLRR